jgi:hypothetical protein
MKPGGLPIEVFDDLRPTARRQSRAVLSRYREWPFLQLQPAGLLSVKLLKNGTLKVYEKFPHGMCTTHADVVNRDLFAFIKD